MREWLLKSMNMTEIYKEYYIKGEKRCKGSALEMIKRHSSMDRIRTIYELDIDASKQNGKWIV